MTTAGGINTKLWQMVGNPQIYTRNRNPAISTTQSRAIPKVASPPPEYKNGHISIVAARKWMKNVSTGRVKRGEETSQKARGTAEKRVRYYLKSSQRPQRRLSEGNKGPERREKRHSNTRDTTTRPQGWAFPQICWNCLTCQEDPMTNRKLSRSCKKNIALRQPRGLLLPKNEAFELLLKALSTRLAGNHLVTAVIQCSQFHEVNYEGSWQGDLGGGNTFIPWRIWYLFLSTRLRASATNASHDYAFRVSEKLCWRDNVLREAPFDNGNSARQPSFCRHGGRLSAYPLQPSFVGRAKTWKSRLQPNTGQTRRHEVMVPRLLEICKDLVGPPVDKSTFRNTLREVGLMSQTLSVGSQKLLEHIYNTLFDASESEPQANVLRTVQGIAVLQEKLQETVDEDEQRALEEDITGKARIIPLSCNMVEADCSFPIDLVVLLARNPLRSRRNISKCKVTPVPARVI
ncbi:hypothetical protein F5J12DRAFT_784042 [Pisolithus orientalis]|uniref:uncharacterized protein n=1 Tax=Pisolithus orientalis TaxID=936130 RepID=UPI00222472E5|nr:uncharacterized protein F5J12DRAFT_784042 [Pisolithus orientalis]KAI6002319.1 hypothetical protein F5J12DRAFT_784042 [Pisolithus orientalis]